MAAPPALRDDILPLASGDRLTRDEFERRYNADSSVKKAELIEGRVYVASPVSPPPAIAHSNAHAWLAAFALTRFDVLALIEPTVRLDLDNEPQPDIVLARAVAPAASQREGYLTGTPDLVVEIAASSASYDLHDKLNAYRRNGVQEFKAQGAT